jgi:hypothetical protein
MCNHFCSCFFLHSNLFLCKVLHASKQKSYNVCFVIFFWPLNVTYKSIKLLSPLVPTYYILPIKCEFFKLILAEMINSDCLIIFVVFSTLYSVNLLLKQTLFEIKQYHYYFIFVMWFWENQSLLLLLNTWIPKRCKLCQIPIL